MPKQPLAEVFGFPITNMTNEAIVGRSGCLCPFGNKVPECTKDKKDDPLGVCSIFGGGGEVIITCPIRFRQDWIIAEDAARFFFPASTKWTTLTEVRLKDKYDKSAGNIDVVLVSYDDRGKVTAFGALEVQAVYISGNVRNPFEHYMEDPKRRQNMDWAGRPNYPHADYLSSSRKRLAPQLIFKGGIFKAWGKKTAFALNAGFFNTRSRLKDSPTLCDPSNRIGGDTMPMVWRAPEEFLTYEGVSIFHAYKDDFSDVPLEFWYSTCSAAPPGSEYEFDVRDLPNYQARLDVSGPTEHQRVIGQAINARLLRTDLPPTVTSDD